MRPFVKVEGYRIGEFNTREPGLERRAESRRGRPSFRAWHGLKSRRPAGRPFRRR